MLEIAGIMAAGSGQRIVPNNDISKPMILYKGKHLIDYGLDNLKSLGIKKIFVITRPKNTKLIEYLENITGFEEINVIKRNTTAALESFLILNSIIGNQTHIIQSCDIVADIDDVKGYFNFSIQKIHEYCMILLTSKYVHDEKPIWINTSTNGSILDYGKTINPTGIVFANLRVVNSKFNEILKHIDCKRFKHLTELMKFLVKNGYPMISYCSQKNVLDIDRTIDMI